MINDINIKLRPVTSADRELLFHWTNEPEVRQNSLNTGIIQHSDHVKWFESRLNSTTCKIFILENESQPAGQIRFEWDEVQEAWIISFSVSTEFRGLGLGHYLVGSGILMHARFPIVAYVKKANQRSSTIFERLGFETVTDSAASAEVLKFIKYRNDENY